MWQAIIAGVKKFGSNILKSMAKRTAVKATVKTGNAMANEVNAYEKNGTSDGKTSSLSSGLLFIGGGAVAMGLSAILVAVLVVVVFIGLILSLVSSLFSSGSELTTVVNEFWVAESGSYGTSWEIRNATETQKLGFLLENPSFWERAEEFFVFDQETMQSICKYAEQSRYYTLGECETEVYVYDSNDELLEPVKDSERVYDSKTPVYVDVTTHTLSWQVLYALLASSTDQNHIDDATVRGLAHSLTQLEESEKYYDEKNPQTYQLTNLSLMDTVREGPRFLNSDVGQYDEGGKKRSGLFASNLLVFDGESYSRELLSYSRLCPVCETDTDIHVWDGTLLYDEENASYFYEMSSDTLMRALAESGLIIDNGEVISCLFRLPGGYQYASRYSEMVGADGIDIQADAELSALSELIGGDSGMAQFVQVLLRAFGFNLNIGSLASGNTDYESYVERTDYRGDTYYILQQYKEGPDIYWWSQNQYDNDYYGPATIHMAGCGPTSLAIVYSSLTGNIWTPPESARWCYENGYIYGASSASTTCGTASIFSEATERKGLRVDYYGTGPGAFQEAVPYLDNGDLIVCNVGRNAKGNPIFAGQGHFLVVRGVTDDGKVLLADPGTSRIEKNTTPFEVEDLEYILDRASVGNTGRVWAIGYDGERRPTDVDWREKEDSKEE